MEKRLKIPSLAWNAYENEEIIIVEGENKIKFTRLFADFFRHGVCKAFK